MPHRFITPTQISLLQSELIPARSVSMGLFLERSVVSHDLSPSEEISDFDLNFFVFFFIHTVHLVVLISFYVTSNMNSEKFNDYIVQAWL